MVIYFLIFDTNYVTTDKFLKVGNDLIIIKRLNRSSLIIAKDHSSHLCFQLKETTSKSVHSFRCCNVTDKPLYTERYLKLM